MVRGFGLVGVFGGASCLWGTAWLVGFLGLGAWVVWWFGVLGFVIVRVLPG